MQGTLENVSHELDCIFKTGFYHYKYIFSSHGERNTIQMYLEYQAASAAKRPQESTSSGLSFNKVERDIEPEIMGSEQITDLVRKLGFTESKEDEKHIRRFLDLNEVISPVE